MGYSLKARQQRAWGGSFNTPQIWNTDNIHGVLFSSDTSVVLLSTYSNNAIQISAIWLRRKRTRCPYPVWHHITMNIVSHSLVRGWLERGKSQRTMVPFQEEKLGWVSSCVNWNPKVSNCYWPICILFAGNSRSHCCVHRSAFVILVNFLGFKSSVSVIWLMNRPWWNWEKRNWTLWWGDKYFVSVSSVCSRLVVVDVDFKFDGVDSKNIAIVSKWRVQGRGNFQSCHFVQEPKERLIFQKPIKSR